MSIKNWTRKFSFFILLVGFCTLNVFANSKVKNITDAVTRQIRSIGFPTGSGMGIFFAVSIPVDIPNKAISVSFYFEANYALPGDKNSSYDDYYYLNKRRTFDRRLAYEIVENKLERAGYPGRVCLLRTICDAAKNPISKNGIFGDLLHILLTPSSSKDENFEEQVRGAEYEKDCEKKYNECPVNVLDLITYYI